MHNSSPPRAIPPLPPHPQPRSRSAGTRRPQPFSAPTDAASVEGLQATATSPEVEEVEVEEEPPRSAIAKQEAKRRWSQRGPARSPCGSSSASSRRTARRQPAAATRDPLMPRARPTGLPAFGASMPYWRDLLMHGYPDGWRLPCPGTEFDAKSAFEAIKDQGVTSFITVPMIMAGLLSYDRSDQRSKSLTCTDYGLE